MEVSDARNFAGCAGSVAELNVREFLGSLLHEGLMTEGICEYNLAALVLGKVNSGVVAFAVFADAGNDNNLLVLKTHTLLNRLKSLNEVVVIG